MYTDIPEEKIDFSTFCGFICEEEKDPLIQEIALEGAKTVCRWRPVRPIPKDGRFLRERVERIQGKQKRILEKFGKKAAEGDHPSPATHPSKYSRTTSKGAGPSSSKKV